MTLGSNDIERSLAFYDQILGELGARQLFNNGRLYFYGTGPGEVMLAIDGPHNKKEAKSGNGVMAALSAPDHTTVERVYANAMELNAVDEGAPGNRMPTFYGAYFRDPDGNKICVCKLG